MRSTLSHSNISTAEGASVSRGPVVPARNWVPSAMAESSSHRSWTTLPKCTASPSDRNEPSMSTPSNGNHKRVSRRRRRLCSDAGMLGLLQPVAKPTEDPDTDVGVGVRQFPPQPADEHLDRGHIGVFLPAIQRIEYLRLADDAPGAAQQEFEHGEFARCEFDLAPTRRQVPRCGFERQGAEVQSGAKRFSSSQERANPGLEFRDVEGFGKVVVTTAVQSRHALLRLIAR